MTLKLCTEIQNPHNSTFQKIIVIYCSRGCLIIQFKWCRENLDDRNHSNFYLQCYIGIFQLNTSYLPNDNARKHTTKVIQLIVQAALSMLIWFFSGTADKAEANFRNVSLKWLLFNVLMPTQVSRWRYLKVSILLNLTMLTLIVW